MIYYHGVILIQIHGTKSELSLYVCESSLYVKCVNSKSRDLLCNPFSIVWHWWRKTRRVRSSDVCTRDLSLSRITINIWYGLLQYWHLIGKPILCTVFGFFTFLVHLWIFEKTLIMIVSSYSYSNSCDGQKIVQRSLRVLIQNKYKILIENRCV